MAQLIPLILEALSVGWQLTALPGYAILYKESTTYEAALAWWRRTDVGVDYSAGPARTVPPAAVTTHGDGVTRKTSRGVHGRLADTALARPDSFVLDRVQVGPGNLRGCKTVGWWEEAPVKQRCEI
jgi:hypothetical protein